MTITTGVRVHWPIPPVELLDHVTRIAGGDPSTVKRAEGRYDEGVRYVRNRAGQGLRTLAAVQWCDEGELPQENENPEPPALAQLSVDNPYGFGEQDRGRWVHANVILPAVAAWLDEHGVPRDRWWWEDETAGTWHPGTTNPRHLDTNEARETWEPVGGQGGDDNER